MVPLEPASLGRPARVRWGGHCPAPPPRSEFPEAGPPSWLLPGAGALEAVAVVWPLSVLPSFSWWELLLVLEASRPLVRALGVAPQASSSPSPLAGWGCEGGGRSQPGLMISCPRRGSPQLPAAGGQELGNGSRLAEGQVGLGRRGCAGVTGGPEPGRTALGSPVFPSQR